MAIFTIQLSNGVTEQVSIPGSEDLSKQQLQELLAWSNENSERRIKVQEQKRRYKTISARDAYNYMEAFQRRLAGEGKIF